MTLFSEFGHDPLAVFPELMEENRGSSNVTLTLLLFANGNNSLFREGLLHFIHLSQQLQSLIN